jgi:DNA-binding SARP family transcriptional activator/tetratricopeptide (TPR) repeat protein
MASRRATPRLEIRLLGPPEVFVDGHPLEVDTRKAIAILALLAADGRPYGRDELAALLWPDSDDAGARGALRRTLSTLRSAVGDGPLVIDRARVALARTDVDVDLATVEAAARSTDRRTLARGAAAARGAFLAGFNLRDSPEFDDWRATRAVAVERAVLTVLDRLAATAEADGDLAGAIDVTARRLELDPLDEAAHVRLMDLLVATGDRSAALRQYRACVATLERELGVAPLASTTARYEAIRDGATVEPELAPTEPPDVRPLPLVGRDAAIRRAEIVIAGRPGQARVVTIVGEAGIGKTRLAEELASRAAARHGLVLRAAAHPAEQGIAYGVIVDLLRAASADPRIAPRLARLDGSTRGELARLLPAMADARQMPRSDGPGAHARLVLAIADGLIELAGGSEPGLIWIDDVQWLDRASREAIASLVRRLVDRPVAMMMTWRAEDLDAESEAFAGRLRAVPGMLELSLARLDRPAIDALIAAAPASPDPAFADRLASASEGLPLYLVEALAAASEGHVDELPIGVGTVLRERLGSLPEATGQIVAAASVIGRTFDLETLRHASGRSETETVEAIEVATRRGICREAAPGYDFAHGALRDLAYASLSLARRRLVHRRVAEALRLDLGRIGRDDLARLVRIADHERAAGRDAEAAVAYRVAGDRAAELFANREAVDLLEAAVALGDPDPVGARIELGTLRTRIGDYDGAIAGLEAAAAQADGEDVRTIEWRLGRAHLRRGDLAAAAFHLEVALADDRDPGIRAALLVDRSVVERRRGDLRAAHVTAAAALAAAESAGDAATTGAARRMLGLIALDAGDAATAAAELRRAVVAAADDPDPTGRIAALVGLAMASAALGDLDEAVRIGDEAAARCRTIGDRHLEGAVENHVADILHAAGRDAAARPHQLRAMAAFAEVGGDPADPDPGIWMLSAS